MAKTSCLLLRSNANYRNNAMIATLVIDKDKTSYEALAALSHMLLLASKTYKNERGLTLRMMNLYSSAIGFGVKRFKEKYFFDISMSCPIDRYVGVSFPTSLEAKVIKTCDNILKNGFEHDEVALMLAKGKMIRDNNNATGNPMFLAYEGLKKNFFPDSNIALSPNGDDTKILSLTFDDLEKALSVVRSSKAYVGCVGFQKKASMLSKLFDVATDMPFYQYDIQVKATKKDLSLIKDNITSSSLVIGYTLKMIDGPRGDILAMLTEKLLSDDNSPLFLGLREERGLTYGVEVSLPDEHKAMLVSMILDKKNVSSAIKASDSILAHCTDLITEERLEEVKKTTKSAIDSVFDSPSSYAYFLRTSLLKGYPSTKDEYVTLVESITLDEVKDVLKTIEKVGSFTVDPMEAQ